MKNVEVALVIAVVDMAAGVEVFCEDIGIFINGSVLNNRLIAFADLAHLAEPAVEKINLQVESPPGHVFVKIAEVRILFHRFVQRSPAIMPGELLSQRRFSRANVSRDGDVFN